MSDHDEHQIAWGLPGPIDPVERAHAHIVDITRVPFELERPRWPREGVPDVEQRLDADDQ
jgi:hypothetical protein